MPAVLFMARSTGALLARGEMFLAKRRMLAARESHRHTVPCLRWRYSPRGAASHKAYATRSRFQALAHQQLVMIQ